MFLKCFKTFLNVLKLFCFKTCWSFLFKRSSEIYSVHVRKWYCQVAWYVTFSYLSSSLWTMLVQSLVSNSKLFGIFCSDSMQVFNQQWNPVETNSKCSGSTILGFGTPRIENCLKYSGSTFHIYMKMEPPVHKAVSKVYLS